VTNGNDYGLVLKFDDESESFVLGFEAGIIWNKMSRGDHIVDGAGLPCHRLNIPLLVKMADIHGYDCNVQHADKDWSYFGATKQPQTGVN